jgi:hypothetical protein
MSGLRKAFAWGPPSHKSIAWVGALAGVLVLALAGVVFPRAHPLFVFAVAFVGLAELGWAIELLPRRYLRLAASLRLVRWLCALAGMALGVACLILGVTPAVWFGVVIAGTGVLLGLEMAPGGPANRP